MLTFFNRSYLFNKATEEKIIINDPDQEYGEENKEIDLKKFSEAWEKRHKLLFVIKGERK